jgi:hypothetical protein
MSMQYTIIHIFSTLTIMSMQYTIIHISSTLNIMSMQYLHISITGMVGGEDLKIIIAYGCQGQLL